MGEVMYLPVSVASALILCAVLTLSVELHAHWFPLRTQILKNRSRLSLLKKAPVISYKS